MAEGLGSEETGLGHASLIPKQLDRAEILYEGREQEEETRRTSPGLGVMGLQAHDSLASSDFNLGETCIVAKSSSRVLMRDDDETGIQLAHKEGPDSVRKHQNIQQYGEFNNLSPLKGRLWDVLGEGPEVEQSMLSSGLLANFVVECCDPKCENGHIACSSCCSKLTNKCPSCSWPIGYNRCLAIEKVMESIKVSCRNAKYGCKETVSYNQKHNHEETCIYAPCKCPLSDCSFHGSSEQLSRHFSSKHWASARRFRYNCPFPISFDNSKSFLVLQAEEDGLLFLLNNQTEIIGNAITVTCMMPSSSKGGFSYDLISRNGGSSLRLQSFTKTQVGNLYLEFQGIGMSHYLLASEKMSLHVHDFDSIFELLSQLITRKMGHLSAKMDHSMSDMSTKIDKIVSDLQSLKDERKCENGCSSCCSKLTNKCPSSSCPIGYNRRKVIESTKVSCRNAKYGCKETVSYTQKHNHEDICVYAPCKCPLSDCSFHGSSEQLSLHFSSKHWASARRFRYNCPFAVFFDKSEPFLVLQVEEDGLLFLLNNQTEIIGNAITITCMMRCSSRGRHSYDLISRREGSSLRLQSFTKNTEGRMEGSSSMDFLLIPNDFCNCYGQLKLEICIWSSKE
ncbi:hypothetical protein HHK36_014894 [Tetracentron sinense]|uniref:RING-type E3 ubiquitin transferase n=1 Tax=Tetracentron sinense TaxID=13715 RepID=A0A835DD48_TETSI|nr:hypothetical protein HHK36_014894 [Tetracentron sinense]